MRPKQKILEFIHQAYEEETGARERPDSTKMEPEDRQAVRELFDGMSTGAARIIRPDGSAIRRLLVDKQTGDVQFAGR